MSEVSFVAESGAGELSANAFVIEVDGLRLLLDAGARPGRRPGWVDRLERPDLCWVSHAHFDHIGGLTSLVERHVGLPCLATAKTRQLAALAIAGGGVEKKRAEAVASQLQAIGWRRYFDVSRLSPHEAAQKMRLMAFPAGHIPGAAMLLVEVDAGDESPFRILYTGDFCAHDQPLVDGALFPKTGPEFSIDVLVMEGVLATNKEADEADYAAELRRCVDVALRRDGAAIMGVSALGEAVPVAKALVDGGCAPLVHSALEAVFEGAWPDWRDGDIRLVDEAQAGRALDAGSLVIAPGDQFGSATPAGRLAGRVAGLDEGLIVVFNRAYPHTVAGRLVGARRGDAVDLGGHDVALEARVERFVLPNHASRSQLVATARALDPERILLVHGQRSQLFALKRAVAKAGFTRRIDVPANGERLAY